jgi:hypothetical protein
MLRMADVLGLGVSGVCCIGFADYDGDAVNQSLFWLDCLAGLK